MSLLRARCYHTQPLSCPWIHQHLCWGNHRSWSKLCWKPDIEFLMFLGKFWHPPLFIIKVPCIPAYCYLSLAHPIALLLL
jgi:hypothetical protein